MKRHGRHILQVYIEAIAWDGRIYMINGSKNKGDWSEFYALIYLLGTKRLFTADENLGKMDELFFPILKILKDEKQSDNSIRKIDFVINNNDIIEVYVNSALSETRNVQEFIDEATALKSDIVNASGRQFVIPHGEVFLNSLHMNSLAASSQDVTDIRMELHDSLTGIDQKMGFSIKSYLGGAPTLFNASGATNFKYLVTGITPDQMVEINSIDTRSKIVDRLTKIYEYGGKIKFQNAINNIFSANLMMLDSRMEELIGAMLLYSYKNGCTDCAELISIIENLNPLQYPRSGFYEYKFKKFLCAKALGMDPSKEWNGTDDANGGYIVVREDGEVLAYHLYNRDMFEQYLFDNTYLERASTTRHGYASLYMDQDVMYINFNLQIRFKDRN